MRLYNLLQTPSFLVIRVTICRVRIGRDIEHAESLGSTQESVKQFLKHKNIFLD